MILGFRNYKITHLNYNFRILNVESELNLTLENNLGPEIIVMLGFFVTGRLFFYKFLLMKLHDNPPLLRKLLKIFKIFRLENTNIFYRC